MASSRRTSVSSISSGSDATRVAERAGVGSAAAMRYLDDDALRTMAAAVAEMLADEIPAAGGDPWAGPERLLFPAAQAGRFAWSLGLVVEASLQTGDTARAVLAMHAVIGLSRIISEAEDGASVVVCAEGGPGLCGSGTRSGG